MEVEQLPRGRHRLSREAVEGSQRERLLLAMADAVAEGGYAKTSVADVLRRAKVSRETFYEQFENKEACFLVAYDAAAQIVAGTMAARVGTDSGEMSFGDRLERILGAYLATLAAEPAVARTFLVEVYAAGPKALARRVEVQTRFVDLVAAVAGATGERQRFACEALVASVSALVTQRVCAGEADRLEELSEPLRDLATILLEGVGIEM